MIFLNHNTGQIENENQRETLEQPDSGVGSLESPKDPNRNVPQEPSQPAEDKQPSPPATGSSGPMRAMEQFEGALPTTMDPATDQTLR